MEKTQLKKLIIYYSLEGNTKLMAEAMAEAIGADVLQLTPKKELRSTGFSKFLWGGTQVMMKKKPELLPLNYHPLDYDLIILGTPVWAWSYAPPIATLLSTIDFSGKLMALYCCHGGNYGKTFTNLKTQLSGSTVLDEIDFFEPRTKDTKAAIARAKEWAQGVVTKGFEKLKA